MTTRAVAAKSFSESVARAFITPADAYSFNNVLPYDRRFHCCGWHITLTAIRWEQLAYFSPPPRALFCASPPDRFQLKGIYFTPARHTDVISTLQYISRLRLWLVTLDELWCLASSFSLIYSRMIISFRADTWAWGLITLSYLFKFGCIRLFPSTFTIEFIS